MHVFSPGPYTVQVRWFSKWSLLHRITNLLSTSKVISPLPDVTSHVPTTCTLANEESERDFKNERAKCQTFPFPLFILSILRRSVLFLVRKLISRINTVSMGAFFRLWFYQFSYFCSEVKVKSGSFYLWLWYNVYFFLKSVLWFFENTFGSQTYLVFNLLQSKRVVFCWQRHVERK